MDNRDFALAAAAKAFAGLLYKLRVADAADHSE
jgi:hypothetical protein